MTLEQHYHEDYQKVACMFTLFHSIYILISYPLLNSSAGRALKTPTLQRKTSIIIITYPLPYQTFPHLHLQILPSLHLSQFFLLTTLVLPIMLHLPNYPQPWLDRLQTPPSQITRKFQLIFQVLAPLLWLSVQIHLKIVPIDQHPKYRLRIGSLWV